MRIKINFFCLLCLIWLGLMGPAYDMLHVLYMMLSCLVSFFLANKLNLIPKKNILNINSFAYIAWLLKEVLFSSWKVSLLAWKKFPAIQPSMEPVKTIQKTDFAKVIYANSITLTPGTVTLSLEDNYLMVHALDFLFMEDVKEGEMDRRIEKIIA